MKTKTRTVFVCGECGVDTPKWAGQCPACGRWNTLKERAETAARPSAGRRLTDFSSAVAPLANIQSVTLPRRATGLGEFDRVLGGGLVPGSLVLLGGPPGIGKSTLILQAADRLAKADFRVLYVSGEESPEQVRGRAARVGVDNPSLLFASETDLGRVIVMVKDLRPGAVVVSCRNGRSGAGSFMSCCG